MALWLGPPAAGSSRAHSGPGSAQSHECAQGLQRGHPCSPSSTPPICCHLRRHMLPLHTQKTTHAHFGGQWLPASQAGGENKTRGKQDLALHRPNFQGSLGQAPPAPSLRVPKMMSTYASLPVPGLYSLHRICLGSHGLALGDRNKSTVFSAVMSATSSQMAQEKSYV